MNDPTRRPATVAVIAAVARNGAIGRDNDLLWRDPQDMAHFRAATLGCPVVMGRRTWDSLPPRFRPLPGRRNVVVTRNAHWHADGAEAATSLEQALARLADAPKVFVIGGAQLYALALPLADELVLTEIDAEAPDADAFFPPFDRNAFIATEGDWQSPAANPRFRVVTWRRREPVRR